MDEEEKEEGEIVQDWTDDDATEAEAMGWIPPERAGKIPEGKKFIKPREYMERNPLYKKMKLLETSFGELNSHYQKVSENEYKKAEKDYKGIITKLEAEKVQALDEGDNRRAVDIDKEIRATEKPEVAKTDPAFNSWVGNNDWYENDPFLRVEADRIGERYSSTGMSGQTLLDTTRDHLKQLYPEKFGNKERDRPSGVEGTTIPGKGKKATGEKDLTPDEKTVFKNFNDMGVFKTPEDKAKYIREVIEIRD